MLLSISSVITIITSQKPISLPQTPISKKDSAINDEIDKLRQRATMALLTRRDVIVGGQRFLYLWIGFSGDLFLGWCSSLKKAKHLDRDEIYSEINRNPVMSEIR
jgi:excinuclease UvrABC helicase subunit UvrB